MIGAGPHRRAGGGSLPLRLAHVAHWRLPSDDTATIQLVQTLSALAALGVAVELFIPRPAWRPARTPAELRRILSRHYAASCEFLPRELASAVPLSAGASRVLHAIQAARLTRSGYDVVHTRDLETAWLAVAAGSRVLFETYRPLTRRSGFHRRILLRLAARPGLLGVVTHSRYARARYLEDGFPEAKIRTVYNGFDPAAFRIERTPAEARRRLGFPQNITVGYVGRLAPFKRIDLLLEAARRTPELSWVLVGATDAGEARGLLERGRRIANVSFPGFLRGEQLVLALQAADILVIPPSASPLAESGETVLPIKLFQYLAAGRAVVTGDTPDTAELLVDQHDALRLPLEDLDALVAAIRGLARNPERRRQLGSAARETAAGFTWEARARAMLEFLRERGAPAG